MIIHSPGIALGYVLSQFGLRYLFHDNTDSLHYNKVLLSFVDIQYQFGTLKLEDKSTKLFIKAS